MPTYDVDLVTAAHRRLKASAPFAELVAEGIVGTDAPDTASDLDKIAAAWCFQGLDDEGRPVRDPEGSGKAVVVVNQRREWTTPNPHNTADFPVLQVLIYVDSDRNADGSVDFPNAARKCRHIVSRLDRVFHLVANRTEDQSWLGFAVHSSLRGAGLDIRDVPNTQGATVRGELTYNTITD